MNRWRLLAHMALTAADNGKEHQEVTLANYLQQAYETGYQDALKATGNLPPTDPEEPRSRAV